MKEKVCAVVVTYNRKTLLAECLNALKNQTRPLDGIYIIDNASTDGTPNLLLEKRYIGKLPPNNLREPWEKEFVIGRSMKIHYVRMNKNTGGSGGFYEGIKRAYEMGYDWIWVMDDDATPKLNALEELMKFKNNSFSAIASVVLKRSTGEVDLVHRRIFNKLTLKEKSVELRQYQNDYFYFNEFSYVGVLINSNAVRKYGFTNKDFFILYDDTEHSLRLSKYGRMICVTSSHIIHGSESETRKKTIDYKNYYGMRNKVFTLKKHGNPFIFFFFVKKLKVKNYIAKLIKRRDNVIFSLLREAIKDGIEENLGIKMPYVPGWKYQRVFSKGGK